MGLTAVLSYQAGSTANAGFLAPEQAFRRLQLRCRTCHGCLAGSWGVCTGACTRQASRFGSVSETQRRQRFEPLPWEARAGLYGLAMGDNNIWTDDWDSGEDWSGGGSRSKRLPRGVRLGASVYELRPGEWVPFHFHHGSEELLVVLRGSPTLRTATGTRELAEGETVHFAVGPEGVHGVTNETSQPVRYLMASTLESPEVVEYPDLNQITAQAHTASQTGERLWLIHDLR